FPAAGDGVAAAAMHPAAPGGALLAMEDPVTAALAASPDVQPVSEQGGGISVRGGSSDHNVLMLDGAPILGPYHQGPVFLAVNPEMVGAARVYASDPPASMGDAVSGVIALESRAIPAHAASSGALGLFEARAVAGGPVAGGRGAYMVAARRSTRDLFAEAQGENGTRANFADAYARGEARLGPGLLEGFVFQSSDGLGFDASAPGAAGSGSLSRNDFAWRSRTASLAWTAPAGDGRVRVQAWDAGYRAGLRWHPGGGAPVQVDSRETDAGVQAAYVGGGRTGLRTAGLSVQRLATSYAWADAARAGGVEGRPLVATAFGEGSAAVGVLRVTGGLRAAVVEGGAPRLGPRLRAELAAGRLVGLSASYARTWQHTQSLRNEQSFAGLLAAAPLPVAAGDGVPQPWADHWAAGLSVGGAGALHGQVEGYLRRERGLLLVAPATGSPFATDRVQAGSARAAGVAAELALELPRWSARGAWGLGSAREAGPDGAYRRPAPYQSASLALEARLSPVTRAALSVRGADGRAGTLALGGFTWTPNEPLDDVSHIAGSPDGRAGPLGGDRLPPYLRVDAALARTWTLGAGGRRTALTGTAELRNLLNRHNVLGRTLSPETGAVQSLYLIPRALVLSLQWRD
ncbi:MAG: TonB-dependent receptor plug, partial [Gemmatimonadetes bacterium]|nr:TonB-dependent receptor plug [Gemmatimonadota bacterium]